MCRNLTDGKGDCFEQGLLFVVPKSSESETKYEEYGVKWPVRALKQVLSKNLLFHAGQSK